MQSNILYDDIQLPEKVSDILQHDFWTLSNVKAPMVRTVTNPVKFSAFTSIFITEGECLADINLITYRIKAPALISVAAGDIVLPREVRDDFDASFSVLSSRLRDTLVATIKDLSIFTVIGAHPILELSPDGAESIKRLYRDLEEILAAKSHPYPFETLLFTLSAYFYRHASIQYEKFRQDRPAVYNNRITDRFIRLVQEHFRSERFLDFYAKELGITPKHLSRTVRQQTSTSAVDWITRFVILEAKVMLRSSNLNIQEIAEELHFPSQSFFGKYFKKATGISPKEYRNNFGPMPSKPISEE
ncbi:MAG: AraC family transcriptional regulator [Bacteroides sp.]|nr:AraC family transcriptional regulator [Bacteroides sp.]